MIFKHFFISVLFSIIILISCNKNYYGNKDYPDKETLTVMTYNIHHGRGINGKVDLERIARVIIDEEADIVGLQEVDVGVERSGRINIAKKLSTLTGLEYVVFGKNIDHQGGDYGNATLSKYPIIEFENVHFERLSNEQRGILTTLIDVNGFSLLLMNTHLAHRSQDQPERLIYTQGARDKIISRFQANAIVFLGDFNDVPGSATHLSVKEYLTDTWEAIGEGDGFTVPSDNPNSRIDYIFYNDDLAPVKIRVPVTKASDHLPVVAEFEMH